MTALTDAAMSALHELLDTLELQLESTVVKDIALIWPAGK